jgi:hypothetical protein
MPSIFLPKMSGKILVVGPIYDKIEKLAVVEKMIPQYNTIIFNGGLCYPSDDLSKVSHRISEIQKLMDHHKVIYLAGRSDYLLLETLDDVLISNWIRMRPNIALVAFPNRTVLITDGGLPSTVKNSKDLNNNLEVSFISKIKEKPWHQSYNGGLGYVVSNNPLTSEYPQYYSYSMQLGNSYGPESKVYAQEINEMGLKQTILL